MPDTEPKGFAPPYNVPWATFLSTLEKVAAELPTKIDRSYLESQAGNIQTYLIAAFKGFGLIDNEQRPTARFEKIAANPDDRPAEIGLLLRDYFPTVIPLGEKNSTAGELEQAFSAAFPSVTGESRIKAIRFFLSAAAYAGIKLSPLWKPPKKPRGASTGRGNGRRGTGSRTTESQANTPTPPAPLGSGFTKSVSLPAGGTLAVTVSVNPMELKGEHRKFFYELIDALDAYEESHAAPTERPQDSPNDSASQAEGDG